MAKVCANVDLSEHVVDVIFTIFDEDGDGALSNKEFVAVMKNKLKRNIFLTFIYLVHHMSTTTNPESTNFVKRFGDYTYLHFCYVFGWHIYNFSLIFCVLGISYADLVMT